MVPTSEQSGCGRLCLKCDGTRAETRFRHSAKRTSPFKSAGASGQSATDSRGVRISGSNAGYNMFRDIFQSTGYPLHSPVSPSLSLPCFTVYHHISAGLYRPTLYFLWRKGLTINGTERLHASRHYIHFKNIPHYTFTASSDRIFELSSLRPWLISHCTL